MGTPQEEADWLKRLREETKELLVKRDALTHYIANGCVGASHMQASLMREQLFIMEDYAVILHKRIALATLTGGH